MKYVLSFFFCLAFFIFDLAAQQEDLFKKGVTAFNSKNYQEAIKAFESIRSEGNFSEELYYNLGNAYYESDDKVNAILNYERCLKIDPYSEEASFNLKLALEEINNEIIEVPDFMLSKFWKKIHTKLNSSTWSFLFLICFWLSVASLIYWLLGNTRHLKKKAFLLGLSLLLLSIFLYFFSASQSNWENRKDTAIIMAEMPLNSAPEIENEAIMKLEPGMKIFLLDQVAGWHKIRLKNGQVGWLRSLDKAEII